MKKKEIALQAKHKPNPNDISPLEKLRRDIELGIASGKGYPAELVFEKLMAKYRDPV
jgi:hypothetical protein